MQQLVEFAGNHMVLSGIWVALVVLIIFTFISAKLSPIKELTTHELTMLVNKDNAQVIDIRDGAAYRKGHILGANLLKQEQLKKADFTSLEKHKDKPIIVVCNMGMTAKTTASQMLKAGFSNVSVLKGGMGAWESAGLPVAK